MVKLLYYMLVVEISLFLVMLYPQEYSRNEKSHQKNTQRKKIYTLGGKNVVLVKKLSTLKTASCRIHSRGASQYPLSTQSGIRCSL